MTKTRNKLKIMGLVLALVMMVSLLGLFSLTASAAEATIIASGDCSAEGSSVQWKYDNTGTLTISGTGAMENWSSLSSNSVPWYNDRTSINKIVISSGVTSIGNYAFNGCSNLTSVNIPNSVTSIGYGAFLNCSSLASVTIPGSVTIINGFAFDGCSSLASVNIPDSVTSIGDFAFEDCSGLTSVTIGNSVTSIGNYAFDGCSNLASVNIPDSVTSIGNYAFRGCSNLTSVNIPDSVTSIGYEAFYGCSSLESVTIGNSVTSIGKYAFEGCSSLASVNIPDSVTSIGSSAFEDCSGLTSVTIGNSVTSIGNYAFNGCSSLASVNIPNSLTSIGNYAFRGCSSLASVNIPDSLTSIGEYAFNGCSNLTSVTIGNSVTSIGSAAFRSCTSLTSITAPCKCTVDGQSLYDGETLLYTFGDGVEITIAEHKASDTGAATCTKQAVCGACGASYGELDTNNHTGGTATCTTQAVCEACGASYGELNPNNHEYEKNNGICCDTYQPAELNDGGYYEIGNAGQLFWFAQQVNVEGNREIKGVLTADIDLENRPWTPIGETGENNKNFRGVFDGQNHTIKGLYVEGGRAGLGFFGEVRTGTVKNFTIYGEVVVNTEVDYVGGVIGSICGVNGETDLERNGAIIQNITSYVNLTAKAHGVGMIGGFVGYANHQSLIENCSWYGTFDAGIYRVDSGAGGFIGKIQENTSEVTIRNCAAYGTIKTNYAGDYNNTATIYMGGFLSFSNTGAKTTLENCLFAGKFERGENLTDQAFLGAFGTLRSVNAIKNCYYLGDDGLEAVHSNSDLKPGSDNVEITSVTKAQLLSGEVAYKLGEHFGQILEGENRQSYPVLGGEAVPSSRFEIYGQQLGIGSDLSMKYYVMGYAPEFNSKGLYMEFSHNGVKTKVYADEPNADGFYVFVLEGINPQCMGDSIRAKLYYNETEVTSHGCEDGKEYSVEKNLLNLLEKYKDDAALVALINDTLAYGKAAEAKTGHTSLEGNNYTGSQREIPESELSTSPEGDLRVHQATVRFGTMNHIVLMIESKNGAPTVKVGEQSFDVTLHEESSNYYVSVLHGVSATDFGNDITVTISDGTTTVDYTVSINDYLYAISQSSTDEKMVNLAKALYNYGVSAKEYAASQNN